MSKVEYENQGYGVLGSHLVIAEEYLKQNGKKVSDEEMKKIVMKLAREKADSYTPSLELGKNPESRISPALKKDYAPWLYGKNSILNSLDMNKTDKEKFMIELNGAINHLTQILLKGIYGFKIHRKPNANTSDPRELTDFEYVGSGPSGMSKHERDQYNTRVDVNRQIRGIVQAYITASIIPIIKDNKNNLYKNFQTMYQDSSQKFIKSNKSYKMLMGIIGKMVLFTFGTTTLSDYLKDIKFRTDGGLLKGKIKK